MEVNRYEIKIKTKKLIMHSGQMTDYDNHF